MVKPWPKAPEDVQVGMQAFDRLRYYSDARRSNWATLVAWLWGTP